MNDNDFNDLVESIKQAGKIKNGSVKPERLFHFNPIDIKKIREKLHKSQTEFAFIRKDLQEHFFRLQYQTRKFLKMLSHSEFQTPAE
jgi:hypothetical protein